MQAPPTQGDGSELAPAILPEPQLAWGTVGWEDDTATNYYDLGTTGNDGNLLVHVQLFRGRDKTKPRKQGVAQGTRIHCQVLTTGGIIQIPTFRSRVVVAFPDGLDAPGGAVIIGLAVTSAQASQLKTNRTVFDFGPNNHVIFKGKSVNLQSYATPSAQFISCGVPLAGGAAGIYLVDETGSGFSTQSGEVGLFSCSGGATQSMCHLTPTVAELISKATSTCGFQCKGGNPRMFGTNCAVQGAGVYLGSLPTAATAVCVTTPSGSGATGVGCTSVYAGP